MNAGLQLEAIVKPIVQPYIVPLPPLAATRCSPRADREPFVALACHGESTSCDSITEEKAMFRSRLVVTFAAVLSIYACSVVWSAAPDSDDLASAARAAFAARNPAHPDMVVQRFETGVEWSAEQSPRTKKLIQPLYEEPTRYLNIPDYDNYPDAVDGRR
jgi:hypothetical protein